MWTAGVIHCQGFPAQVGCFPQACCRYALEGLTLLSVCGSCILLHDFPAGLSMQSFLGCVLLAQLLFGPPSSASLRAFPALSPPTSRHESFAEEIPPSPVYALCGAVGLWDRGTVGLRGCGLWVCGNVGCGAERM